MKKKNPDSQFIQNHAALENCVGLFVILHLCVLDLILQEAEHTNMEHTGHGDEEEQIKGDETGLFFIPQKAEEIHSFQPCCPAQPLPGQFLLWPELPFVLGNERGDNVFTVPNSNEGISCACLKRTCRACVQSWRDYYTAPSFTT